MQLFRRMPAAGVARSTHTYRRMLSLLEQAAIRIAAIRPPMGGGGSSGSGEGGGGEMGPGLGAEEVAQLQREVRAQGKTDGILHEEAAPI